MDLEFDLNHKGKRYAGKGVWEDEGGAILEVWLIGDDLSAIEDITEKLPQELQDAILTDLQNQYERIRDELDRGEDGGNYE